MSMIVGLRNAATATRLKEGSLEALVARIEKMTVGMSDIDKAKLEKQVADAFTSVSALLDEIELAQVETRANELRGNSRQRTNPNTSGFRLPRGGMNMSKRKKRARQAAEERAFAELQDVVETLEGRVTQVSREISAQLPDLLQAAVRQAVERAVEPYRAAEAMREKEALVADYKGWGKAVANLHTGVLV